MTTPLVLVERDRIGLASPVVSLVGGGVGGGGGIEWPAVGALVASDTFDRANGAIGSSSGPPSSLAYTSTGTAWTVSGNRARPGASAGLSFIDPNLSSGVVGLTFVSLPTTALGSGGARAGIQCRRNGAGTAYVAAIVDSTGKVWLYNEGGNITSTAAGVVVPGSEMRIYFTSGGAWNVYVDGVLIYEGTSASAGGRLGLYSQTGNGAGMEVDDLHAWAAAA